MAFRRAYLSDYFRYLGRRLRLEQKKLEAARLSPTQVFLIRALFDGAGVSVVLSECCCGEDQRLAAGYAKLFQGFDDFDLDASLWDFQDSTGLRLSLTQRWLIRAMFGGGAFCLSMSGGAGYGEGDPGGGRGEEDPGGGRGEEDPGGGRGEEYSERDPGGGR